MYQNDPLGSCFIDILCNPQALQKTPKNNAFCLQPSARYLSYLHRTVLSEVSFHLSTLKSWIIE